MVTVAKEFEEGYGKYIVVDHGNGVQTLYAHCESLDAEAGSTVERGDAIAFIR
ncbi:M23 family metallopeptidase [Acetanaerobacterium elongatum]|uniref:M23 family metallopeptidase n=1 Tax=Acetanaerobacterium elongatum TaxID=258515 RepID=UPI000B82976C